MSLKYATDEQTGVEFVKENEQKPALVAAGVSLLYSIVVLFFLLWLLFDTWYGEYKLISLIYTKKENLNSQTFRLIAFTFIGGCLGGSISSIRGIISWHCEQKAFGARFIYKHITQPWIGGTLALFVFALLRSGVGILGGEFNTSANSEITKQILSLFALGALAGYGSRQVYKWIDHQVNRIFKVDTTPKIPDLAGRTKEEAEATLIRAGLKLGKIEKRKAQANEQVNAVVEQNPAAGLAVDGFKEVNITIVE